MYIPMISIHGFMDTRTTTVHGGAQRVTSDWCPSSPPWIHARRQCTVQGRLAFIKQNVIFLGGVCLTGAPQRVTSDLNVDPAGMYLSIYLYISYISTSLLYVYKLTSLLYLHPAGMYLRYISYIYAFYMYIPMICIYDLYLISTSPLYLHPAGMHLRLYLYIPYVHPAGMTLCI